MNKEQALKAIAELRKNENKNFDQSVDLIINLQKIDLRKTSVNSFLNLPHSTGKKKIAGFLTKDIPGLDIIKKEDFKKFEGKSAKKLAKNYEFFISAASLMPTVASVFGRTLGAAGKMPSPQLGIVALEDEKTLKEVMLRMQSAVRIKPKEPSIKVKVGKQSMKDEEIAENIDYVYNSVLKILPLANDNIKNALIKFTMSKPVRLQN